MKKLDSNKLKEIGKKIGIFLAVLFVFFSWFLVGVRYGRKHPNNNTVASADDSGVLPIDDNSFYYIPLNGIQLKTLYKVSSTTAVKLTSISVVQPKTYLILKDGSSMFGIGGYGAGFDLSDTSSLNIQDNNHDIQVYEEVDHLLEYDLVTMWTDYEVIYNDTIDWSSISQYRVVGVTAYYNYITPSLIDVVNNYHKDIVIYDINLAIGEDDTIHIKIAYYPFILWLEGEDIEEYYEEDIAFYVEQNSARNIKYVMPFNNYASGYYDGYASGYNYGVNSNDSKAFIDGYNKGYADSHTDGNTLRDVVRTAIETPVNMFKTILNWNFLGYNLFTLFSTIITIIIVVFVLKKLM